MTGALHMGANTIDGSAVAFTGGTIDGSVIGGVTPAAGTFAALSATGLVVFSGTGALTVPNGTTAQRPDTGNAGEVRWNSTTSRFEFGVGGSYINHVKLAGDVMTGSLTINGASSQLVVAGTGVNTFSAKSNRFGTASAGNDQNIRLTATAGQNASLDILKDAFFSAQIISSSDAQSGNNQGSNLKFNAFTDAGVGNGSWFVGTRGSGPLGTGNPAITRLAPYAMAFPLDTAPGGTIGNFTTFANDHQSAVTLGTNPLAVTNGSPLVTITWTGSCAANGPIAMGPDTWVNLTGATAVGGITPTGFLLVTAIVDNDHFQVTWTANATSTVAAGGGSSVVVRPYAANTHDNYTTNSTNGAAGTVIQKTQIFSANPDFYAPTTGNESGNINFLGNWWKMYSPNDPTGAHPNATLEVLEADFINRGANPGYFPAIEPCDHLFRWSWQRHPRLGRRRNGYAYGIGLFRSYQTGAGWRIQCLFNQAQCSSWTCSGCYHQSRWRRGRLLRKLYGLRQPGFHHGQRISRCDCERR
jgi:hypothetical protein